MFSPEKSHMEICLLKSNLEEIENDFVVQRSSWPDLDAETEQKFRDSLNAVRISRTLGVEIENLNQENVRSIAKRMHLKIQSYELSKALEKSLDYRNQMELSLDQEYKDWELHIRKYEDSLREKAERFRKAHVYYNEEEMRAEIEKNNNMIAQLETDKVGKKNAVEDKRRRLEEMKNEVPEDLLQIVGKNELEEKAKSSVEYCDLLKQKRNDLFKRNNPLCSI